MCASCQIFVRIVTVALALGCSGIGSTSVVAAELSAAELAKVGQKIWRNECGGTRDGLTSWNVGEDFASLGIGHFIWYPAGVKGPFKESFPGLIAFFSQRGVSLPPWLTPKTPCPWKSRSAFLAAFKGKEMTELRDFLAETVGLQSEYLAMRMERSFESLGAASHPSERANVRRQFNRLRETAAGTYALIDYVNFKGEGTSSAERYNGRGWGLLQVLQGMGGEGPGAVEAFAKSAEVVLRRRVENAPPARNEQKWLAGWLNRVRGYASFR
jgi:hypothetical protein